MKAVVFAGGTGTRLWPLSRKKSPKQFEKIIGDKSTLQLAVDRLSANFAARDIYVATNTIYKDIVKAQLPHIPVDNFIFEPDKRDVGPAVALAMGILVKKKIHEPVAILWSDHLVKKIDVFSSAVKNAGEYIKTHPDKIVFIGHKPRFASQNLGWIHYGQQHNEEDGTKLYSFEGFKYRPDAETAEKFFASGHYAWNLGYFVATPQFVYEAFKRFAPEIHDQVQSIVKHEGTKEFGKKLEKVYPHIESISFDNAVLEQLDKKEVLVVVEDIGWSDVGAWEALKEALEESPLHNVTHGTTHIVDSKDSIIYNYDKSKLVVGVDLDEMIVVNTADVLLVAKKTSVPKIKKVVEQFAGTQEFENLT